MALRDVHRKWWRDLPILEGIAPDGSGSGNAPATLAVLVANVTQTTNTSKLTQPYLVFDNTTDNHWQWNFVLPRGYVGGGKLYLWWASGTGSGNVIWKTATKILGAGDSYNPAFNAVQLFTASAVPGAALKEESLDLTMTGASGGEILSIMLGRDPDNASDTYTTALVHLWYASFECQVA